MQKRISRHALLTECWWGRLEGKGIQGAGLGIAKYVGFRWDGKRGYQIKGIPLYGKI